MDNNEQNLDQIRNILMGPQVREQNAKLAGIERHIQAESESLRTEIRTRFNALEDYFKQELQNLSMRLDREGQTRREASEQFQEELDLLSRSTKNQLSSLEQQSNDARQALKQQIHDRIKTVNEEQQQRHEALSREIKALINDVEHRHLDKRSLSNMLMDLALQVSGQDIEEFTGVSLDPSPSTVLPSLDVDSANALPNIAQTETESSDSLSNALQRVEELENAVIPETEAEDVDAVLKSSYQAAIANAQHASFQRAGNGGAND